MILKKIIRSFKEKGFVGGIKYGLTKITGIYNINEKIETIYYILNNSISISDFPKATGNLRQLQECDAVLLCIFAKMCEKHGLTYWLDYGTLLGAYRHKGFIPWDDDLDVAMPRVDYNKALEIFPSELKKYGIDVYEFEFRKMNSFGFSFKHNVTGIWLDVFPVDSCFYDNELTYVEKDLEKKIFKYRKIYLKKQVHSDRKFLNEVKNRIFSDHLSMSDTNIFEILYHGPESIDTHLNNHDYCDVYPLQKIFFENFEFKAPRDLDKYLSRLYGANYNSFPKSGVLHHGNELGNLSNWASLNGIDMCEIKKELLDIAEEIEHESCSN